MDYDVVLCSYNGELYIEEQIKSILCQTIKPKNIIVSDDGSTDRTLSIVNEIINKYIDCNVNISLLEGPKEGLINNFFNVLRFTSSKFVFFSDQDDIWVNDKVSIYFNELINNREWVNKPLLLFSDAYLLINDKVSKKTFFETESLTSDVMLDHSIYYKNCVQGASMMVNRELIQLCLESLKYTDRSKILMHDWWFALLTNSYGHYLFINKPLIFYRQHDGNTIGTKSRFRRYLNYILNVKVYINTTKRMIEQKDAFVKTCTSLNMEVIKKPKRTYNSVGILKKLCIFFCKMKY
ncbi:glycosyltransferase family 2 protein [Photobacterium damselae]|uniref:glycosyltransferase family 2 protein n=1 Tax=Photobacterium damselae TaxID=38293 RepID=UPI002543EE28